MTTFNAYWKTLVASETKLDSRFYLLYDLIKGRDPRKSGFSQITNPIKLANGQSSWQGLDEAKRGLAWALKSHSPESLIGRFITESGFTAEELAEKLKQV